MSTNIHELIMANAPPLEIMEAVGGFYECPKGATGKRLGPLVGYAGKYNDAMGVKKQKVGDVYLNFAKAEEDGAVLGYFGDLLYDLLTRRDHGNPANGFENSTGFCGAPEGGKALAVALALDSAKRYIYPEKKVVASDTVASRGDSELEFGRHEPQRGETLWIVEDVCNNFSTTGKLISLIENYGASVQGIICFLNRSTAVDKEFALPSGKTFPVISLVRKPFDDFRQDHPFVAEDIETQNVVWSPKKEWPRLQEAMQKAKR